MAHIRKRTLSDGSTAYRVVWDDPSGKRQTRQFSKATGPRPAEAAKDFKVRLEDELRRGTYVDPRAGDLTFREVGERWMAEALYTESSRDTVERSLRLHIYPALGSSKVGALRRTHLQLFIRDLSRKPVDPRRNEPDHVLAPNTIKRIVDVVRAVLTYAVRDSLIPATPARGLTLPVVADAREDLVIPTAAQVHAIADEMPPRYRGLVLLAAGTGLRSGELRGLDLGRLRVLERVVRVNRQLVGSTAGTPRYGPPKTRGGYREVPMAPTYAETVAEHLRAFPPGHDGLVFTNGARNPLVREVLRAALSPVLRRHGFPVQSGMHLFRHFYASALIANGADVLTVMRLLGHTSSKQTLETYGHLWHDHMDRVRTTIDAAFPALPRAPSEALSGRPGRSGGAAAESARRSNTHGHVVELRPASSAE